MRWGTASEARAFYGVVQSTLRERCRLPVENPKHIPRRYEEPGNTNSARFGIPDAGQRFHADEEAIRRVLDEDAARFDEPVLQDDDGEEPIRDLLARRLEATERHAKYHEPTSYTVKRDGPFAVCYLGDPHIDDDGCDLRGLMDDVAVIKKTPGLYVLNIGDTVNNWVGKLQGKYRDQTSTEAEAFRMARWLLFELQDKWDGVVLGNHDLWNQGSILFGEYAKQVGLSRIAAHEVAIDYDCGSRTIGTVARHYFPGHSMWHPTHGALRWARMRSRAHVFVQGHIHEWGSIRFEGIDGDAKLCMVVRGYKRGDDYAHGKGYQNHTLGRSTTVIYDPGAKHPHEIAIPHHDVREAADRLRYLQGRRR